MKMHVKTRHLLPPALALLPLLSGCDALTVPEPAPLPAPAKVPTKPVFSPTDYVTRWAEGARPGAYRVQTVINGDTVAIQSVTTDKQGRTVANSVAQVVRLAGIVAPQAGQPGYQGSVKAIRDWTMLNPKSQTVEVENDPKFPFDEDRNMNVQIYFKGTSEATAATTFNLNRMMVRSGWAIVDLHTPTALDLQLWLNDQEYAQRARLGLWKEQATLDWIAKALLVPRRRAPARTVTRATGTAAIRTTATGTTATSTTVTRSSRPAGGGTAPAPAASPTAP
jgi:endonuclease YncB( thermonuclease family)